MGKALGDALGSGAASGAADDDACGADRATSPVDLVGSFHFFWKMRRTTTKPTTETATSTTLMTRPFELFLRGDWPLDVGEIVR